MAHILRRRNHRHWREDVHAQAQRCGVHVLTASNERRLACCAEQSPSHSLPSKLRAPIYPRKGSRYPTLLLPGEAGLWDRMWPRRRIPVRTQPDHCVTENLVQQDDIAPQ